MNYGNVSPMLRHALESFEHGLSHYLDETESGRKFALLHVDHAIELIAKEKLARIGKSIFKSDGKTLGFHEAFNSLTRETDIPERPRLEELHNFRNIVQHKGLTPDEFTTQFYIAEAYGFVERFLRDELGIELTDFVPAEYQMVRDKRGVFSVASDGMHLLKSAPGDKDRISVPIERHIAPSDSMPTRPLAEEETITIQRIHDDPEGLFALEVEGDSMIDALLHDGDIVIARRQERVEDGQAAIVWMSELDETTIKSIYYEGDQVRLQPVNPTMSSIVVPADQVQIQARVVMVVRQRGTDLEK